MLGFPILYCKGMRPMMFQLSGFCYKLWGFKAYTAWGSGFVRVFLGLARFHTGGTLLLWGYQQS